MSSGETFDPYHVWLGIPKEEQPPNHYRLLGIRVFEDSADVIENAADRQMAHLRAMSTGKHREASQRLLNEISNARVHLLNPDQRTIYDQELLERFAAEEAAAQEILNEPPQPFPGFPTPPTDEPPAAPPPPTHSPPVAPPPQSRRSAPVAPSREPAAEAFPQLGRGARSAGIELNDQPVSNPHKGEITRLSYQIARQRKQMKTIIAGGVIAVLVIALVVTAIAMTRPEPEVKPPARPTVSATQTPESATLSSAANTPGTPSAGESANAPAEQVATISETGTSEPATPEDSRLDTSDTSPAAVAASESATPLASLPTGSSPDLPSDAASIPPAGGGSEPVESSLPALAAVHPPLLRAWTGQPVSISRLPVPSSAEQQAARANVEQTIGALKQDTPDAMAEVARLALQSADRKDESPANRIVMYEQAIALASGAGDFYIARAAAYRAATQFSLDGLATYAPALATLAQTVRSDDQRHCVVVDAQRLADEAASLGRFDLAATALSAARQAAGSLRDSRVTKLLDQQQQQVMATEASAHQPLVAKFEALAKSPDNPRLNQEIAEYFLLTRGDAAAAMPYLANAPGTAMTQIAKREIELAATPFSRNVTPAQKWEMAEAWHGIARQFSGPLQTAVQARARAWAIRSFYQLEGLELGKAKNLVVELDEKIPRDFPGVLPTRGLALHFDFNRGRGGAVEEHVTGLPIQGKGPLAFVPGHAGAGLSFPNSESTLTLPGLGALLAGTATMTFWVKSPADSRYTAILAGQSAPQAENLIEWGALNGGAGCGLRYAKFSLSNRIENKEEWNHIGLVRNAETGRAATFLNGVCTTVSFIAPHFVEGQFDSLGQSARPGATTFQPTIDDLRIYRRALEDEEIYILANLH